MDCEEFDKLSQKDPDQCFTCEWRRSQLKLFTELVERQQEAIKELRRYCHVMDKRVSLIKMGVYREE